MNIMEEDSIEVLLIDANASRRELLQSVLGNDQRLNVVGVGEDLIMAGREIGQEVQVDVLVIGVDNSNGASIESWAQIHLLFPEVSIVALMEGESDQVLLSLMGARANGIQRIDTHPRILCQTIWHASRGIVHIDQEFVQQAKRVLILKSIDQI